MINKPNSKENPRLYKQSESRSRYWLKQFSQEWVAILFILCLIIGVTVSFRYVLPVNPNSYSLTELKERGSLKLGFIVPFHAIEDLNIYSPEYYIYLYGWLNPKSSFIQHAYVQFGLNILSVIVIYLIARILFKRKSTRLLLALFFGTSQYLMVATRESCFCIFFLKQIRTQVTAYISFFVVQWH